MLNVAVTLQGSFQGLNSTGAITLAGAQVGDLVYSAAIGTTTADYRGSFERTISVAGEIQQTSGSPLSAYTFDVVLLRTIVIS